MRILLNILTVYIPLISLIVVLFIIANYIWKKSGYCSPHTIQGKKFRLVRFSLSFIKTLIFICTFIIFFPAFNIPGMQFVSWMSIETYSRGDIPNKPFYILIDIPKKDGSSGLETIVAGYYSPQWYQSYDNRYPGWSLHITPGKGSFKPGRYSQYRTEYTIKQISSTRTLVELTHGDDDTGVACVYELENNNVYPKSYQLKYYWGYGIYVFVGAMGLSFICMRLFNRFIFRRYFPTVERPNNGV